MSRKFSKREGKIIKFMIVVLIIYLANWAYEAYAQKKLDLQFQIETSMNAQTVLLERLKDNPKNYIKQTKVLSKIMEDAEERILRMKSKNDAQFLLQEDITKVADKTDINLNSLNKRRSKELYKGSELTQVKAYFGFNCPLVNLLDFLGETSQKEYFMAVDTLNINVNKKRKRRRRDKKEETDEEVTVRGSCVLATLYQVKQGEEHNDPVTEEEKALDVTQVDTPGESPKNKAENSREKTVVKPIKTGKKEEKEPATKLKNRENKEQTKVQEKKGRQKAVPTKKELAKKPRPLTHTNKKRGKGRI
ncbi:MAG: hypothetical protein CSA81_07520 [Acidobacteria bacterium]|nr:MAG: hypothetical protein CSA81_07520 [Acidobacteriota bacterium]